MPFITVVLPCIGAEEGLAQAMAFEGASSHEGDDDVMGGAMDGGEGQSGGQFVVCGTHKVGAGYAHDMLIDGRRIGVMGKLAW